jgi:holin-like protein
MAMTRSAAVVLTLLILGDVIAEHLVLPIPGAALGLAALATSFAIRGGTDKGSEELFDFAAPYFPLFFVPAAVGVVASLDILAFAWIEVTTAIVFGTAATILITGLISQALLRPVTEEAQA